MPSLDILGDCSFEDKIGILVFLQAHAARHSAYAQAAATTLKQPFASSDFNQYPDSDWFQRHYNVHTQLASIIVPNATIDITVLMDYDWSDEDSFYQWMQTHTALHTQIDEFFEIDG